MKWAALLWVFSAFISIWLKDASKKSMFELPVFRRQSLDPVRKLHSIFGNPGDKYKTLHITGTNGKGSVAK